MRILLAIDPGTYQSGIVEYDVTNGKVASCGIEDNAKIEELLGGVINEDYRLAIEMIGCYGMPVGRETFETCVWIGRFLGAWNQARETQCLGQIAVYRREVKLHLCNSARAKDKNIRQAILDCFMPSGGGKTPQIGTKAAPGPLYGVKSHIWAALGVALTFAARERL